MEQQIIATWAQVFATLIVGLVQCGLIAWGLRQMGRASEERNRQLDIMEAAQREQSRTQAEALGKIGEGIAELLRRRA